MLPEKLFGQGLNPLRKKEEPLPPLEIPNPEDKFPMPTRTPALESGVRSKDSVEDEELLMERVKTRVAIDELKAAVDEMEGVYMKIQNIKQWEPEEKWDMLEKMVKVSEAMAKLKYPDDLVKQTEDHAQRMKKYIQAKGQITSNVIQKHFIDKAKTFEEQVMSGVAIEEKDDEEEAA